MKRHPSLPPPTPSARSSSLSPVARLSPSPPSSCASAAEQRRSPRLDLEIVVGLDGGDGVRPVRARELSTQGLFLKTDSPLPLRRLVRLSIDLDDGAGEPLRAMAMVARSIAPAEAHARRTVPGMGVQLYGLGAAERARWARWLGTLADRYAAAPPTAPLVHVVGAASAPADAVRRLHARYELELEVHLIGAEYERTHTYDVSLGGASVYTEQPLEPGDTLELVLLGHDGEERLELASRVVRRFVAADRLTVALTFTGLDPATRDRLEQLVLAALPEEADDELEIVDDDDPLLE